MESRTTLIERMAEISRVLRGGRWDDGHQGDVVRDAEQIAQAADSAAQFLVAEADAIETFLSVE